MCPGRARPTVLRICVLVLVVVISSLAWQDRLEGQDFNELLDYPLTAKCAGMAAAVSSLAGDYSAIAFNPATLGFVTTSELHSTLAHSPSDQFPDKVFLSAGAIYQITEHAAFGVQLGYSGESERQVGIPRAYSIVGRASYGARLGSNVSVGASAEIVHDAKRCWPRVGGEAELSRGYGWGIDTSVLYKMPTPTVNLALSVLNLGPDVTYSSGWGSSRRSQVVSVGASTSPILLKIHELTICSDVSRTLRNSGDSDWGLNLGVEYDLLEFLYLRGGYFRETDSRDGFAFGGGLKIQNWMLVDAARQIPDCEYDTESSYFLTVTLVTPTF